MGFTRAQVDRLLSPVRPSRIEQTRGQSYVLAEKVMARVKASDDCLIWPGANNRGYGVVWDPSIQQNRYCHVVIWEANYGPVPEGLTVDHECHVTRCQNIAHLRLLTRPENSRDGAERSAQTLMLRNLTHCLSGHEFTDQNTYRTPSGFRRCRACQRDRARRYYHEKKAASC